MTKKEVAKNKKGSNRIRKEIILFLKNTPQVLDTLHLWSLEGIIIFEYG